MVRALFASVILGVALLGSVASPQVASAQVVLNPPLTGVPRTVTVTISGHPTLSGMYTLTHGGDGVTRPHVWSIIFPRAAGAFTGLTLWVGTSNAPDKAHLLLSVDGYVFESLQGIGGINASTWNVPLRGRAGVSAVVRP